MEGIAKIEIARDRGAHARMRFKEIIEIVERTCDGRCAKGAELGVEEGELDLAVDAVGAANLIVLSWRDEAAGDGIARALGLSPHAVIDHMRAAAIREGERLIGAVAKITLHRADLSAKGEELRFGHQRALVDEGADRIKGHQPEFDALAVGIEDAVLVALLVD